MLQTFSFILQHVLVLLGFLASAWGYGRLAIQHLLSRNAFIDPTLSNAIATVVGVALIICALQWLGIAGQLRTTWVFLLLAIGLSLAALRAAMALLSRSKKQYGPRQQPSTGEWLKYLVPGLLILKSLLSAFEPPVISDELTYHLPHAQQWALLGSLTVNEWLRYPWFPFNYELLYAAALLTADDIQTHLLNAMAGWLILLMIYRVGLIHVGQTAALVAVTIWLILVSGEFNAAYIDMGVTLFVFCACMVFHSWWCARHDVWLLALSAFLLGVAVGSKYQTLTLLPFFAVATFRQERRVPVLMLTALCLIVPCAYWYARNAYYTGDPFSPFGGRIFGFTDWNLDDYNFQLADVRQSHELSSWLLWPGWLLWPAFLVPATCRWHKTPAVRRGLIFGSYAVLVWAVTSNYPRYLMPAYPVLALLAACSWDSLLSVAIEVLRTKAGIDVYRLPRNVIRVLVVLLVIAAFFPINKTWKRVASNPEERRSVARRYISGFGSLEFLARQPYSKTYQFGIEYGIYYVPQPIWGDTFGRWRYRDFQLPPSELQSKLIGLGFQRLVVNVQAFPGVIASPNFAEYFSEIYSDPFVHVYEIKRLR